MHKVPPCNRNELVKKLRVLGFEGPFAGGKHSFMKRGKFRLTIPNLHGSEISPTFIKEILKQGGITIEEWMKV